MEHSANKTLRAKCGPAAFKNVAVPRSPVLPTNHSPSRLEVDLIRDSISQAENNMSLIDQEIGELQALMDRLRRNRQAQEKFIEQYHLLLCPIRRLPPELLSQIFLFCLPGDRHLNIGLYRSTCLLLSQICSHWRDVAISTRMLWTSVHLELCDGPKQRELEIMDVWLARSTPCPLTLSVNSPELAGQIQPVIDMLIQHSSRWENISFNFLPPTLLNLGAIRNSLPSLKALSVEIPFDFISNQTFDAFECAPQLRYLKTGIFVPPSALKVPWGQLIECVFNSITLRGCLEVFHQTPHLVACELNITEEVEEIPPHQSHVHLDELSTLKIAFENDTTILLDHLTLPALQSLYYSVGACSSPRHLSSLLARSACPLHTLQLESAVTTLISEDDLLDVLQVAPSLVELILHCGIPANTARIWVQLTHRESENTVAPCLLAKLQVLRICCPSSFDYKPFADMVQSRWRLNPDSHRLGAASDRLGRAARLATVEIRLLAHSSITTYQIGPVVLAHFREFRDEGLNIYTMMEGKGRVEL